MFERKLFIKDLYNLELIYGSFDEIHFKSPEAFFNFRYYDDKQIYTVPVKKEDVDSLIKSNTPINFLINDLETAQYIISQDIEDYSITADYDIIKEIIDNYSPTEWYQNNWLILKTVYNAKDFFETYKRDLHLFNKCYYQKLSYDLRFDWASFENAPISTLHMLRFVCNQLCIWSENYKELYHKDNVVSVKRLLDLQLRNTPRIYVNEKGEIFSDENFTVCYLSDIEKEKTSQELTKIYSLVKLNFNDDSLYLNSLDVNQNFEIMKDIFCVPYIMTCVGRWLGGNEL